LVTGRFRPRADGRPRPPIPL